MTAPSPLLELTWSGFDVAVDLIAVQCCWRDRSGVHAATADGEVLAELLPEIEELAPEEPGDPAPPTEAIRMYCDSHAISVEIG